VLNRLIATGRLPRPRRGIRLLFSQEHKGFMAFLDRHRDVAGRTVAGLNLDMVGEDQVRCACALRVNRVFESNATFADDLIERLCEEVLPRTVRWRMMPGLMCDNLISDPVIDIPTPSFIQHPEPFYHSSADTIDNVDATILRLLGVVSGTYLYAVAQAGEREAAWLAEAASSDARARIVQAGHGLASAVINVSSDEDLLAARSTAEERLEYLKTIGMNAVESTRRLAPKSARASRAIDEGVVMVEDAAIAEVEHVRALAEEVAERERWALPWIAEQEPSADMKRAARMVVERTQFGPIAFDGIPLSKRRGIDDGRWGGPLMTVLNWCDGERALADAIWLASQEMGRPLTGMVDQVKKCEKLGRVTIRKL
jgi:predicted transcriptional regulator